MTGFSKSIATSEHQLEVRYTPTPEFLDLRGDWTRKLIQKFGLAHWLVTENRVDVYEGETIETSARTAFVSFRNAGYLDIDSSSAENFFTKASIPPELVFSDKSAFNKSPSCTRIGVRSKFCVQFNGSFQELLKIFNGRFPIPSEMQSLLKTSLSDVGHSFDYKNADTSHKTKIGPMASDQLATFFPRTEKELPDISCFLEIDSSIQPNKSISGRQVAAEIKKLTEANWSFKDIVIKTLSDG